MGAGAGKAEKETNSWCSAEQIGKSVRITEFPRITIDQKFQQTLSEFIIILEVTQYAD